MMVFLKNNKRKKTITKIFEITHVQIILIQQSQLPFYKKKFHIFLKY